MYLRQRTEHPNKVTEHPFLVFFGTKKVTTAYEYFEENLYALCKFWHCITD